MSAILRELTVMRGLASCGADDAAIAEAEAEYRDMLAALRAAAVTISAVNPHIDGLPDHPTLAIVRAAIARTEGRS